MLSKNQDIQACFFVYIKALTINCLLTCADDCYATPIGGRIKCCTPSVCPSRADDKLEIGKL